MTNTSVWPWQTLVTSHGIKAMLKYMHLLSQSSIACDKFARASRGVKVIRELMDESGYRKDCMDVARKMLEGARPSSRTEMVMQLEEAGIIPAIFEHLKDKKEPVPMKVAAVELIKAMQADEDEATSDAVKTAVDRYPEVRAAPSLVGLRTAPPLTLPLLHSGPSFATPSTTCSCKPVAMSSCWRGARWTRCC